MVRAPAGYSGEVTAAVFFDVDGTLIDSVGAHARAWSEALAEAGYQIPAERIGPLIGMGGDRMLPELVPGLSVDAEPGKTIADRRRIIFQKRELPTLAPTPGARQLVLAVRARGARIVVASSAQRDELDELLGRAGVTDLIDVASTANDAEESKPAPDIIEAALGKARVAARDAVMVGDTRFDIEAAHRAGVPCVALRCGGADPASLVEAEAVYSDPRELAASLDRAPFVWPTASSIAV